MYIGPWLRTLKRVYFKRCSLNMHFLCEFYTLRQVLRANHVKRRVFVKSGFRLTYKLYFTRAFLLLSRFFRDESLKKEKVLILN